MSLHFAYTLYLTNILIAKTACFQTKQPRSDIVINKIYVAVVLPYKMSRRSLDKLQVLELTNLAAISTKVTPPHGLGAYGGYQHFATCILSRYTSHSDYTWITNY